MHSTHPPLLQRLYNIYRLYRFRFLNRLFPLHHTQPDLTDEPVELTFMAVHSLGDFGDEIIEKRQAALFTRLPADVACREGWGENLTHYLNLADAAFSLRYPYHPHSKRFRELVPSITDNDLRALLRGGDS